MNNSDFSAIKQYISDLYVEKDPLFQEMEQYATEHSVPIMEKDGLETLRHYLRFLNPEKILEIGTAIGYSALKMNDACPNSIVYTVERDLVRVNEANDFIARKNKANHVHIIVGDALEVSDQVTLHAPFDVLFIDAAKGQYKKFFELYSPLVRKGGFIFSDNVLFKGLVAEVNMERSSKRIEKMIDKIKHYNEWLYTNPSYDTVILPVGDGLAVSRKLHE
ncbi:O-methyltransferase [Bacillus carboniphilus]|uniref:tRNA 5-hydroxyuridine methyltransferase n=1 Tax=Bacillus carboniphilus TaxID=86663 RepID=A0ABN0WE90_9BACI